jgi:hypothetical protein
MSYTAIKATKVVNTALGLLLRQLTLPRLVWRDPVGDFAGVLNDTISVRLPAYAPAHTRVLRSGTSRTKDSIHQRKVDLTLDTDIYKYIGVSDEVLTLDIVDFAVDVLNPITQGIAQAMEDKLVSVIAGASYENTISFVESTDDPYSDIAVAARAYLNQAFVPVDGRVIACGSLAESAFLNSDRFIKANESGSDQTLREAIIGRVAGFTIVSCPGLDPDEAYAFHKTAYAMSSRIPMVPAGAPWGAQASYDGLAMRFVRAFDIENVEDQLAADSWMGATAVKDTGHFTDDPDAGGKFVPVEDPDNPITGHTDQWDNDTDRLVRAVKITVT